MAYEAYGRPQPESYFDDSQNHAEPHDTASTYTRGRSTSGVRQQVYPLRDKMAASPERREPVGYDTSTVSPELIAVITERVKREVVEHLNRTGSIDDTPKATPQPPPPAPPASQVPQAPPLQRQPSNKSSSTSSPPPNNRRERVYTPPSPMQGQSQIPKPTNIAPSMEQIREPSREVVRSPPSSPSEKPSGVRFSDRTPTARPPPGRTFSTMELSTIDQKWGRLFDNDGRPTQRLGQFLRGLANHIIDEFKPQKSIVITPAKMAMYYSTHALDQEPNPLVSIFRAQNNEQISSLYQDLACQHHLVQDHSTNPPTIPGLTALGFAQWMTIHIMAYPDEESKRLEKVVLAMPIDADGEMVDGKPERLPKQISRHLLPGKEDRKSRKLLNNAIQDFLEDLGKSSTRNAPIASPPLSRHSSTSQSRSHPVEIHQRKTSPTDSKAQPLERERNPYAGPPSASESSSNEEPVKIERDRQPYTAQPGNGKIYTEGSNLTAPKLNRANSISTSRTRDTEPVETRESRHHRTRSNASQSSYAPPPRGGRRPGSPPLKKHSDSTPIDLDISGGSKYGPGPSSTTSGFPIPSHSSSFPPPPPPIDIRDNRERRRDDRQYRRGADDEPRFTGDFNSPKDAERWDRYQEAQSRDIERPDRSYEGRGSLPIDPRDTREPRESSRGAAYEDWYREKPREPKGPGYVDNYARNY
ncbi:hypothetical protein D0Z07_8325 [Hyphodiscus hymeniophilus]|uniref:DUF7514 domain-containing protein n=1 Tax=Hyphodiscus hymeniophilus TaxID=353542 RepID=A0A9P6VEA6_9HELO|nr:hypothetical protein D0Z07_8325 [Hyphodiscus hymeniophilus]